VSLEVSLFITKPVQARNARDMFTICVIMHDNRKCGAGRGGATGGETGGNSPPTPHKGHFCKSPKTDEKILGVWGSTSPPTHN